MRRLPSRRLFKHRYFCAFLLLHYYGLNYLHSIEQLQQDRSSFTHDPDLVCNLQTQTRSIGYVKTRLGFAYATRTNLQIDLKNSDRPYQISQAL